MSTWIYITNLPVIYDDWGLTEMFGDIGNIVATNVSQQQMILKSVGFVQFANPKHAKLAASKKDQTVVGNSAIRVYLLWSPKEDLSTIKVQNIPQNITENELEKYFDPYGQIVNIRIIKDNNNNKYALIAFCRVDYALQSVQEMNGTIIGMEGSIKVELLNPDARNLKWKRNSFEYICKDIPKDIQHVGNNYNNYHHKKGYHNNHRRNHHHHHNNNQYIKTNNNKSLHHNNRTNNANIIIVNNIGTIHNNPQNQLQNDDQKNYDDKLYSHQSHQAHHYRRSMNVNGNTRGRGRGRERRYRQHNRYYDDNNNNNNHRRYRNNNNNNNDNNNNYKYNKHKHRYNNDDNKRKTRKYRSNRTNQSTLLSPLDNYSNGQYRTYSVTPSPTRSQSPISDNNNNIQPQNPDLRRMNSSDSSTSNSSTHSTHSLPNAYIPHHNHNHHHPHHPHHMSSQNRGFTALDKYYGNKNNNLSKYNKSPQLLTPVTPINNNNGLMSPISPVTTISTPSTTLSQHSMPTPSAYTHNTLRKNSNITHKSSTPTISIQSSTTTPVSTPPMHPNIVNLNGNMNMMNMNMSSKLFTPQINCGNVNGINNLNNLNNLNTLNNINMNAVNAVNAVNNNVYVDINGMFSPTALTLPLNNMNMNIQNSTSPIVLPPQQNHIITNAINVQQQQHQPQAHNTSPNIVYVVSPPQNLSQSQSFSFGSPTLQTPITNNITPPQTKQFRFQNNISSSLTPKSNNNTNNKKVKLSPSGKWSPEQEQLGNKLHPLITQLYPNRANKIVGMFLLGNTIEDCEWLIKHPDILKSVAKEYYQKDCNKQNKLKIKQSKTK